MVGPAWHPGIPAGPPHVILVWHMPGVEANLQLSVGVARRLCRVTVDLVVAALGCRLLTCLAEQAAQVQAHAQAQAQAQAQQAQVQVQAQAHAAQAAQAAQAAHGKVAYQVPQSGAATMAPGAAMPSSYMPIQNPYIMQQQQRQVIVKEG